VGENSSGKSTFLAGLRYILDFSAGRADPSFNKDPFFLGGYKNIAHFRGGKYGRATEFKIGLSEKIVRGQPRSQRELFTESDDKSGRIDIEITFCDQEGDAKPHGFLIQKGNRTVNILINQEQVTSTVKDVSNHFSHEIKSKQNPSFLRTHNDFLALEYFLREISIHSALEDSTISSEDKIASSIVDDLWESLYRFGPRRFGSAFALAPVRTRPLRNYDPTQLTESSEGDQLISRLGRMARLDTNQWGRVKEILEKYGRQTGLFETIKIQKLGRAESDPFQIMIKTSGREANIIDVGYGISQVLPLFIRLAQQSRHDTLLIQQPEVHLHPRAQSAIGTVISEAVARRTGRTFVIETHSDFIVDRIRMSVRDGVVKASDVNILFFEKQGYNTVISSIRLDDRGEMVSIPSKYREFFLNESMTLAGF